MMMSTLNYLVTNVIFEYVDFDALTRPQPILYPPRTHTHKMHARKL
jgi:hypothetical protein